MSKPSKKVKLNTATELPIMSYCLEKIENFEKISSILQMPPEIIFHVFSSLDIHTLLSTVQFVCKAWNTLLNDGVYQYWNCIKSLCFEKNENTQYIIKVIKKCYNVNYIKISSKCFVHLDISDAYLFTALVNLSHLTSFTMNMYEISDSCKNAFEDFMQQSILQSLDLDKSIYSSKILDAISTAQKLTHLNLSGCSLESLSGLKTFFLNSHNLQYFNMSDCYENYEIKDDSISLLLQNCKATLHTLILLESSFSDQAFENLEKCINLKVLRIYCKFLTDKTLLKIIPFQHLCHLDLAFGEIFTSSSLEKLLKLCSFRHLQHLNLAYCFNLDNYVALILACHLKDLLTLNISYCDKITDNAVYSLMHRCSKMIILDLEGIKLISGTFLYSITDNFKYLKVLNISFCRNIVKKFITRFLELNPQFEGSNLPLPEFSTANNVIFKPSIIHEDLQ